MADVWSPTRPATPRGATEQRLADLESSILVLHTKMDFLIDQAKEQREFRQNVYRVGGLAIGLLVLQVLGFDVSVLH